MDSTHIFVPCGFLKVREALIKSPRAIGERFCSKLRFGKRRNTLCISSFSNRKVGTKDSLSADGYLFRVSLGGEYAGAVEDD